MSKKKGKRTYRLITADQAWDLAESGIEGIQVLLGKSTWSRPDVLEYQRQTLTKDRYVERNKNNTYRVEVE